MWPLPAELDWSTTTGCRYCFRPMKNGIAQVWSIKIKKKKAVLFLPISSSTSSYWFSNLNRNIETTNNVRFTWLVPNLFGRLDDQWNLKMMINLQARDRKSQIFKVRSWLPVTTTDVSPKNRAASTLPLCPVNVCCKNENKKKKVNIFVKFL